MNHFTRRQFLRAGAVGAAGAAAVASGGLLLDRWSSRDGQPGSPDGLPPFDGYGELVEDPDRIVDLPPGFTYTVLAQTGDALEDGCARPGACDGMETFDAGSGRLALCVNHEIRDPASEECSALWRPGDRSSSGGGTTTMIVNPDNSVESMFVSQSDTMVNCAGGRSPWGTWLTCEEIEVPGDVVGDGRGYGFVYDVNPFTRGNGPHYPAMGRFFHEAIVFDPGTGIVYQTEDQGDGLFWRFIPDRRDDLTRGRLEAMAVRPPRSLSEPVRVEWVDMTDVAQSSENIRYIGLERGATTFDGCEGIAEFGGSIYYDEGEGGDAGLGRIWRYRPAQETLELFYESDDRADLQQPDNMRQQPVTQDLYYCEDGGGGEEPNKLVVQSGAGQVFTFARDRTGSEFAGACWDPSGRRLFVNLQGPGLTLVIEGPFRSALAQERRAAAAGTAPTGGVRRADPDQLARAARDRGTGPLEVEAALALFGRGPAHAAR